jgi:MinD superfamily P-loop ATPase
VHPLPRLNEQRCTACGDCVRVCPTRCLEQRPAGPWLPRPTDCVACGLCVRVCPDDALTLEPA